MSVPCNVFIVEDEPLAAEMLETQLQSLGYTVCGHALRGEQALHRIPEARPDIVLMDVNLGLGMSGIEVTERLKERCDVPIVFLTACSEPSLIEQAIPSGGSLYLTKPFGRAELRANLEMVRQKHALMRRYREANRTLDATAAALCRQAIDLCNRERETWDSSRLFRAIVDSLPEIIAVLDPNGMILTVNLAWRRSAAENGGGVELEMPVGKSYFTALDNAILRGDKDAALVQAGIRAVLAGAKTRFDHEYLCASSEFPHRRFIMTVLPMTQTTPGALVIHEGIGSLPTGVRNPFPFTHMGGFTVEG